MSKQREALQLALDALEKHGNSYLNHEDEYSAAKDAIREVLAEMEKTENKLQCWDKNDPEHGAVDPQGMADVFADNLHDDESGNFEVLVSIPLPNRIMRVELSKGEEREMSWEWIE